jgi:hypothetical protein
VELWALAPVGETVGHPDRSRRPRSGSVIGLLPGQSCISASGGPVGGQVFTTKEVCTGFALPLALGIPLVLFVLIAAIVVAIVLISRARARTVLVRT